MLLTEILETVTKKKNDFAIHIKKSVSLIQELMKSCLEDRPPEKRQDMLASLEKLKKELTNMNTTRYKPRVETFNAKVKKLCTDISTKIDNIRQSSNGATFSLPEILAQLIEPFNNVLQQYKTEANEDIENIKKKVLANTAFRLHKQLDDVVASWCQNLCYSSENYWTTGQLIVAGAATGLGIGAAIGGTVILSIFCPPCGIVATGAQIVGYVGGGGLAGSAVVGTIAGILKTVSDSNRKVIEALEQERNKLSTLEARPLQIEDVILLIEATEAQIRKMCDEQKQAAQSVINASQQYLSRLKM